MSASGEPSLVRALLPYARPYWLRLAEVGGWLSLKLASDVVVPWSTKVLIDEVIPERALGRLGTWSGFVFVALAVGSFAAYRWSVVSGVVATRVIGRIRVHALERLHRLSVRFHAQHQSGDLIARLTNDVDRLEGVVARVLPALLFETASLCVIAALALRLNALLAFLVVGVAAPIFAALYAATNRRLGGANRALQDREGQLSAVASEQLHNQLVVKAFGLEAWASERFTREVSAVQAAALRVMRLSALLSGGTNFVFHATRFVVLAVGALFVLRGSMSTGAVVAFFTLVSGLIAPFVSIAEQFAELGVARGALGRLAFVFSAEEQLEFGDVALPPLRDSLELRAVSVSHGTNAVLHDVSLVIPAGALVALVGPSGSGKSTLLALLARFYDPETGEVLFDGVPLRAATSATLRADIAYVPQAPLLFDLAVSDNVRLGRPSATAAEVNRALADAGLGDGSELGAAAFGTVVGERASRLSGGQAQRVAVARALLHGGRLLLLDEATAALDATAEGILLDSVERACNAGRTVVFATHRPAAAARADIIVTLAGGKVLDVRSQSQHGRRTRFHADSPSAV